MTVAFAYVNLLSGGDDRWWGGLKRWLGDRDPEHTTHSWMMRVILFLTGSFTSAWSIHALVVLYLMISEFAKWYGAPGRGDDM